MPKKKFIPCTTMYLPDDQLVLAADTARTWNPMNAPGIMCDQILDPIHIAMLTTKYWGPSSRDLPTSFLEPISNELADKIIRYLNEWNKHCSVRFVRSSKGLIRITLAGQGYWSYLGTDVLHIAEHEPTMCLQAFTVRTSESEWNRVVPHEAGHTLGFVHEHMRPDVVNRLDQQKTISYFLRTQGWKPAVTMSQVLSPLKESQLTGTRADEDSIMCYQLPGSITKDGKPIKGGLKIDELDAKFAASIYPKVSQPEPEVDEEERKDMDISADFGKKILRVRLLPGWIVEKK